MGKIRWMPASQTDFTPDSARANRDHKSHPSRKAFDMLVVTLVRKYRTAAIKHKQ